MGRDYSDYRSQDVAGGVYCFTICSQHVPDWWPWAGFWSFHFLLCAMRVCRARMDQCASVHVCGTCHLCPHRHEWHRLWGQFGLEMHRLIDHTPGFESQLCHSVWDAGQVILLLLCLGLLVKTQVPPETPVKVRDACENRTMKTGAEATVLSHNKKLTARSKSSKLPRKGIRSTAETS